MSLNGTLKCALYRGVVPIYYLNHKPILNCIIIEPTEAAHFGYSEFLLALVDLVLSTQSEKETRYIQYAAGEIDQIADNYCTTIV